MTNRGKREKNVKSQTNLMSHLLLALSKKITNYYYNCVIDPKLLVSPYLGAPYLFCGNLNRTFERNTSKKIVLVIYKLSNILTFL